MAFEVGYADEFEEWAGEQYDAHLELLEKEGEN